MDSALRRLFEFLRTVFLFGRQGVLSVGQNWGIALLSVILASSLWVYVTNKEDTKQTGRVPGNVSVECLNVPPGQAESPPCSTRSVSVRVRAPGSVLDHLTAEDCSATADVAGVQGSALVPVNVTCNQPRVEIVDYSPSQINVTLENVLSRTVAVRAQLVGAPPRGFQAQDIVIQPEEVVVSGPESLVTRVASVEADLDLTGVRVDLDQTVLLKARDEQGGEVQGVNLDPRSARVTVDIVQLNFSAVFAVTPDISGTPAVGFRAGAVQIDPPFVTISGPADIFQTLDPTLGVTTDPISIDGASADVVRTVALRLPPGAVVEQPGVTVRVIIVPESTGGGP